MRLCCCVAAKPSKQEVRARTRSSIRYGRRRLHPAATGGRTLALQCANAPHSTRAMRVKGLPPGGMRLRAAGAAQRAAQQAQLVTAAAVCTGTQWQTTGVVEQAAGGAAPYQIS